MRITVREIIEMIDSGKLHYDQSTQRNFIYLSMPALNTEDGKITRAGNVIRSILQFDIQLPAIYFWKLDNGEYNIHDGKQRILSIYYFINPSPGLNVVTRLKGREYGFLGLSDELQKKLLDYTFDVVIKTGSSDREEDSFYRINTNSVPLTDYESLRGIFHGKWFYGFENFIETKSSVLDKIKKIGRGEQSILFLLYCFELLGHSNSITRLRVNLGGVRDTSFNSKFFLMDEVLETFSEIIKITSISDERGMEVAGFIVRSGWDKKIILDYYRSIMKTSNDVKKWKFDTHKVAIKRLIQDRIKCDGRRFFSEEDKSHIYRINQKCAFEGCSITNYKDLEKDHIMVWSKGGKTELSNLQLLCKSHNSSKGDEDGLKS